MREAKAVLEYEGYRLAAQHAKRVWTLLPEKAAEAWHVIALAQRGLKHWPEALAAIEKATALEADNAVFQRDRALIREGANAQRSGDGKAPD